MEVHEFEGRTEKEAIANAIEAMGLDEDEIDVEVVKARSGLFGGGKVTIRVHVGEEQPVEDLEPHTEQESEAVGFVSDLLRHMGIEADLRIANREDDRVVLEMISDDAGILIGRHGATLEAMQLLTNIACGRRHEDGPRVILDTEDYRYRREQSLTRMAMRVARDVQRSGRSQLLEPMNPFERRLVHTTISGVDDVSTESEGDGPYKQVRVTYTGSAYQHR
ncbi:MAG: protein jag [Spirochaetaceae bacterium]|nr:protein jag [Spirochaetaceae bacterium]